MSNHARPAAEGWFDGKRTFISVGIDVGSSTMHLSVSELIVGRPDSVLYDKPTVLDCRIIHRSPIRFTPFLPSGFIDEHAIQAFVEETYAEAGIRPEQIGAGAVICTGEAAARENATAITSAIAGRSGRFVCASAGHHFEAVLAAHGSGAVEASRHVNMPVVNLDIGGGTTKRTLIVDGVIKETTAINVGSRLLAFDHDMRLSRIEAAGAKIAKASGVDLVPDGAISPAQIDLVAGKCIELLQEFLGLGPLSALAVDLLLTKAPQRLPEDLVLGDPPLLRIRPFLLVLSGGATEFLHPDANGVSPGDMGPDFAHHLRARIVERLPQDRVMIPREGIRATVTGACNQSFQVSGDTVYVSQSVRLPLRSVPVVRVCVDWSSLTSQAVTAAVRTALCTDLPRREVALYFDGPARMGYGSVAALGLGLANAMADQPELETLLVVFAKNIAKVVGLEIERHAPRGQYVCLDEIEVGDLDYIDIDGPPDGDSYLPVTTKSLVFSRRQL